jgi:hypothetical protein
MLLFVLCSILWTAEAAEAAQADEPAQATEATEQVPQKTGQRWSSLCMSIPSVVQQIFIVSLSSHLSQHVSASHGHHQVSHCHTAIKIAHATFFLGSKAPPTGKADNLTAIFEPIV